MLPVLATRHLSFLAWPPRLRGSPPIPLPKPSPRLQVQLVLSVLCAPPVRILLEVSLWGFSCFFEQCSASAETTLVLLSQMVMDSYKNCPSTGAPGMAAKKGSVQHVVGGGISGTVNGRHVTIGNKDWVTDYLTTASSASSASQPLQVLDMAESNPGHQQMQVWWSPALQARFAHHVVVRVWKSILTCCRCTLLWTERWQVCCCSRIQCGQTPQPQLLNCNGRVSRLPCSQVLSCYSILAAHRA